MLHKIPKPLYKRYIKTGAKVLFIAEALGFVGSYGLWYKLNTDRDFRLYMHNNYSSVLDTYYKLGEVLDTENKCRSLDLTIWQQEVLWLLGTGALGYTLLLLTTPDERIVAEKYSDSRSSEAVKKRIAVVETLRLAAESKNPMYRQSKEQIDSDLQFKK